MTTVVAVRDSSSNICLASDSLSMSGYVKDIVDDKIFKVKDGLYVGLAGFAADKYILLDLMDEEKHNIHTEKDLRKFFVKDLRKFYKDNDLIKDQERSTSFLVVFNKKIYHASADQCLNNVAKDYFAIGSGREFAFGSLYSAGKITDSAYVASEAIRCASNFDAYTGGSIRVISCE